MICPKCNKQFEEQVMMCPDCKKMLEEAGEKDLTFVEVLVTFNLADIAIIKSILGENGIEYFFQGENFNLIRPIADPARLKVREDQVELVKELLKDLKLTYGAVKFS